MPTSDAFGLCAEVENSLPLTPMLSSVAKNMLRQLMNKNFLKFQVDRINKFKEVCVCVFAHVFMDVYMYAVPRLMLGVFLNCIPHYIVKQDLPLGPRTHQFG